MPHGVGATAQGHNVGKSEKIMQLRRISVTLYFLHHDDNDDDDDDPSRCYCAYD